MMRQIISDLAHLVIPPKRDNDAKGLKTLFQKYRWSHVTLLWWLCGCNFCNNDVNVRLTSVWSV